VKIAARRRRSPKLMRLRTTINLRAVDVLRFFTIISIGVGLAIAEVVYTGNLRGKSGLRRA